jgi:alanine-synthesizing transaminase
MFTPIQVAATVALDEFGHIPDSEIIPRYQKRRDVMIDAFGKAGWKLAKPNASMFIWAKLPDCALDMGSLEFSKRLLLEADVAVSPGIGFGKYGDSYVRIALIENEKRIRQAGRNIKRFLKKLQEEQKNG